MGEHIPGSAEVLHLSVGQYIPYDILCNTEKAIPLNSYSKTSKAEK
jgi:hypothetical protein